MLRFRPLTRKANSKIRLAAGIVILMSALFVPVSAWAQDGQKGAPKEVASGAAAADPTAAVNFQDLRYRFFDLGTKFEKHSYETEGGFAVKPWLKITNEIHYNRTDLSGDWKDDFEELKLKAIYLKNMKLFGIKSKLALGAEWITDLGDFDKGIGTGTDQVAPLAGIGWLPTEKDFIITLLQYFYSYDEDRGASKVRVTGPRLIYIRKVAAIKGWFKADWKGSIDHNNGDDFTSTLDLQLGTMLTPRVGIYGEVLLGDSFLDTNAYDIGYGVSFRFMY